MDEPFSMSVCGCAGVRGRTQTGKRPPNPPKALNRANTRQDEPQGKQHRKKRFPFCFWQFSLPAYFFCPCKPLFWRLRSNCRTLSNFVAKGQLRERKQEFRSAFFSVVGNSPSRQGEKIIFLN